MIDLYVNYIKPLFAGPMLEKYVVFLLLVLLGIWTVGIINKKRAHVLFSGSFFVAHLISFFVLLCSIGLLIIQTPEVASPSLPLFDPVDISATKPFEITFDRPVSKKIRAQISPHIDGEWILGSAPFRIPYNSLRFYPDQELLGNTEYSVEIYGIAPITGTNLKGNDTLLFVFKTIERQEEEKPRALIAQKIPRAELTPEPSIAPSPASFILNVPQFKQKHTFTCYTVAAKMALAYRGVEIDEVGFLDEIGFDPTERNFIANTWGDPNKGIVGSYDGSGSGGYGVHWDPVARTMNKYRTTVVKRDWNIQGMLAEVAAGNPVIVWWVNGVWPAKDVSWNLSNGQKAYTVNGMHVEVVVGWVGERSNPTTIITNDPWRGRRHYTPAHFNSLWKWFDSTGLVVY